MATHADIGVSQPAASTITMKVGTVTLTRNSTVQHQEIITLGDEASTNGLARVVAGAPNSTHFALVTVPKFAGLVTIAQSTVGQTTATVLVSSAATTPVVMSYTATSTAAGPTVGGFFAGSTLLWPVILWADGGVPTAHQVASPPGCVFKGQADRPLEFRITSGSTCTIHVGVTYWPES